MTIAVDLGRKATKQTNKQIKNVQASLRIECSHATKSVSRNDAHKYSTGITSFSDLILPLLS